MRKKEKNIIIFFVMIVIHATFYFFDLNGLVYLMTPLLLYWGIYKVGKRAKTKEKTQ